MAGKVVLFAALALCCAGAYWHMTSGPSALDSLTTIPDSFPADSYPGIAKMVPRGPLNEYCEPGRVTVFVFMKIRNGACRTLRRYVARLAEMRPDVAIRYIMLDESWDYAGYLARNGIDFGKVPHVLIYDTRGKMLSEDNANYKPALELLYKWINAEVKNDSRQCT